MLVRTPRPFFLYNLVSTRGAAPLTSRLSDADLQLGQTCFFVRAFLSVTLTCAKTGANESAKTPLAVDSYSCAKLPVFADAFSPRQEFSKFVSICHYKRLASHFVTVLVLYCWLFFTSSYTATSTAYRERTDRTTRRHIRGTLIVRTYNGKGGFGRRRPNSSTQMEPQPVQLTPTKISEVLQRPLDHPLSTEETKAMSHLIRAQIKHTT